MADTTLAANARAVAEAWPGIISVSGQSQVRTIANTNRPSEHVFGNALDIYGSRRAMSTLAAHFNKQKAQLSIRTLCYDGGPGPSYQSCTTKHLGHIHISMGPKCGGTIATTGDATERRNQCEQFQQGGRVTSDSTPDYSSLTPEERSALFQKTYEDAEPAGGGVLGFLGVSNPFEGWENALQTVLYVALGAGVLGIGVAVAIKGTDAFKTVQGIATKAVTKGAV